MTRDEEPFAALIGARLSSVEFVLNDYVQLRFDGSTLSAYNAPKVSVGEREHRWGESGYRDALCDRITATLAGGWASDDDIVLTFSDGFVFTISLRSADTVGPEPAELAAPDGIWVWQAGVPGTTHFPAS